MKKSLLAGSAALILLAGSFIAVFCYNTWSLCWGRCTAATFLNPGPFGLALLVLNLLAVFLLLALKLQRRLSGSRRGCRCGATLATEWRYCTGCGRVAEP